MIKTLLALGIGAALAGCASKGDDAPFDPLAGKYPAIQWMANIYEVPGAVCASTTGVRPCDGGGQAKDSPLGEIVAAESVDSMWASIKNAGGSLVAVPMVLAPAGETAQIVVGSKDKAGNSTGQHSLTFIAAPKEGGVIGRVEWWHGPKTLRQFTMTRTCPEGGAVLMTAQTGDHWSVLVLRPSVVRSVKDYPFQTSTSLAK